MTLTRVRRRARRERLAARRAHRRGRGRRRPGGARRSRGRAAAERRRARGSRAMTAAVPGTVYLVGAGPGDPGCSPLRALELLAWPADVVLHDRLVPPEALAYGRPRCGGDRRRQGGRRRAGAAARDGGPARRARSGGPRRRSAEGGDPFVFGRGGEEAQRMPAAGSRSRSSRGHRRGGRGRYAGIPVTHRGVADSVAFVTGHADPVKPENGRDWRALPALPGTLGSSTWACASCGASREQL